MSLESYIEVKNKKAFLSYNCRKILLKLQKLFEQIDQLENELFFLHAALVYVGSEVGRIPCLSTASSLLALLVLTLIIESLSWLFSPQSFCGVTVRVRYVNCSRPFFRADAYTESDNTLRLKKRSDNARLR